MKFVLMDLSCKKVIQESNSYEELKELKTKYEYDMFEKNSMYLTNACIFDKTNPVDLKTLRKVTRLDW